MKKDEQKPDCFGYYDDGDDECENCKFGDSCFEKGAI